MDCRARCLLVTTVDDDDDTKPAAPCRSPTGIDAVRQLCSSTSSSKTTGLRLARYDSLPSFMRHNEFILDHYRVEWPLRDTILSIFSIHNETLNIWTHLVGFFIFLGLTVGASAYAVHTADASLAAAVEHRVERWPFYTYLGGAMFCLLMSSACHLFSCHSEHTCYLMLRLDYAGIAGLIVTSFYTIAYYSFLCEPFFQTLYMSFITLFGFAAVAVTQIPKFDSPKFLFARAGLFLCMGLSGIVPIVHKMVVAGNRPEAAATTGYELAMGAFYIAGVVVYAARVPERWMPGRFDIAGHSHQLFHVLVVAGAYTHYLAGLVYLRWRDQHGCSA